MKASNVSRAVGFIYLRLNVLLYSSFPEVMRQRLQVSDVKTRHPFVVLSQNAGMFRQDIITAITFLATSSCTWCIPLLRKKERKKENKEKTSWLEISRNLWFILFRGCFETLPSPYTDTYPAAYESDIPLPCRCWLCCTSDVSVGPETAAWRLLFWGWQARPQRVKGRPCVSIH